MRFEFFFVCLLIFNYPWPGLCTGVLLAYIAYLTCLHYVHDPNHTVLYSVVAVAGAVGLVVGFKATRPIIIVATALIGAQAIVV
jgi:hypothetical protein